jgi:hypothetical protein
MPPDTAQNAGEDEITAAQDSTKTQAADVTDPSNQRTTENDREARTYEAISEVANTLREIQGILEALAENSGARLPKKTVKSSMWRPREDDYDMQQTIDYIVKTLPPDDIVQRAVAHMQAVWATDVELVPMWNDAKRLYPDLSGEGQKSLFSWDVLRGEDMCTSPKLSEYGYESDGHPSLLDHCEFEVPAEEHVVMIKPSD